MISLRLLSRLGLGVLLSLPGVLGVPTPQQSGQGSNLIPPSPAKNIPPPKETIGRPGPFVSIDKSTNLFNINGKTQYFSGTNTWWLAHTPRTSDIDSVMQQIANSKLLVTRAWGFGNTNDASSEQGSVFFQELKGGQQYFNFDPTYGIPLLDYVVSKAELLNIKLVLPLLNGLDDLGGINTYATNYGTDNIGFYTNEAAQAAYLTYVSFIVNRYKSSPAIFSWELCNEPRCANCNTDVIYTWAKKVSAIIKTLDPNHLVTLGDEGWFAPPFAVPAGANSYPYQGNNGIDFIANLNISSLDYGTFHMYPTNFAEDDAWGNTYIQEHAQAGITAKKPVVLEEYGSSLSMSKQTEMSPWQKTVLGSAIAGDIFWQMDFKFSDGSNPAADGYGIFYDETAGSDWDVLAIQHAQAMAAKTVGGS